MCASSRGHTVRLGKELGRGGEGSVYEVLGSADLVAKLYHKPVTGEKAAKLATMVQCRTVRLAGLSAWPVELLLDRPGGPVKGFVMPRAAGHDIQVLYGPKSRVANFDRATWAFLVHVAGNLARVVNAVHEHGHVIGDINHGSFRVTSDGTLRLVDCDSLQISAADKLYFCEVGMPTHTPGELQGQSLRSVIRSPNHDAFGLAVLIFQLLFMGRHPFSGRFLGTGEMPMEKAIREFRFAYGPQARSRQMQPPPGTLDLLAVSAPLAMLFERAFSAQGAQPNGRPAPREWIAALDALSKQLATCGRNPAHVHLRSLAKCPWCDIEALSGALLFRVVLAAAQHARSNFNLDAVWAQISAIPSPGGPPTIPNPTVAPTQTARQRGRTRKLWLAGVGCGAAVLFILLLTLGPCGVVTGCVLAAILGPAILSGISGPFQAEAKRNLDQAQSRWSQIAPRWHSEAGDERFRAKLEELRRCHAQYRELPAVHQRRLQELQASLEARQRQQFLDRYYIDNAGISGIGAGRSAILRSYGIETAADVSWQAVLSVPGFGPTYATRLLQWRQGLERNFRFNPAKGVDPADIAAVENEINTRRVKLEQELLAGPQMLRQLAQQILASREALRPHVDQALRAVAQARVDLSVI